MPASIRRRWLARGAAAAAAIGAPWVGMARAARPERIGIGVANAPVGTPPVMSSAINIAPAYTLGWLEEPNATCAS